MIVTPPGMLETLRVGGHSLMMIVTPAGQLEISEYMSALTIDSIDDGLCLFTKDSVRRRPAQACGQSSLWNLWRRNHTWLL